MTAIGAAAAALALVFAGCGIPIDDRARPLASDAIPPSVPVVAPPPAAQAGDLSLAVEVFLLRDSRLAAVDRHVPAPLTVDKAITEIGRGPTPLERNRGLRSALPRSVRLLGTVAHDVPLIDVTESLTGVDGEEQILALAQLVFTLSGLPGVTGVSFARDGRPVEVPTGDGELKGGPLLRQDFAAVAPL